MSVNNGRAGMRTTLARQFSIIVALREGYDPTTGVIHHEQVAKQAIMNWIRERGANQLPYLNGPVTSCEYIYSHGSGARLSVGSEPAIQFSGTISTSHLADMPNEAVEDMLSDLGTRLAAVLGQHRVELVFMDRAWAVGIAEERP